LACLQATTEVEKLAPGAEQETACRMDSFEKEHSFVILKKGDLMEKPENKAENNPAALEGAQPSSGGQPQPAEEPIELRKLFPAAHQDLDALFPDPNIKKLLKEIVESRKKNERFVKKINKEVTEEEESE
jgi:hypothetical protein